MTEYRIEFERKFKDYVVYAHYSDGDSCFIGIYKSRKEANEAVRRML